SADGHGLLDRIEDGYVVLLAHLPREIVIGQLVDVHRSKFEGWPRSAVVLPPFQDLREDDVGVRVGPILRHNSGDRTRFARIRLVVAFSRRGAEGERGSGDSRGAVFQSVASGES